MLLTQPYNKESFLPPIDKENANFHANKTNKQSNFFVKKPSRPNPRFQPKNMTQGPLEPIEGQPLRPTKLVNLFNQNTKDGWVTKKASSNKVRRVQVDKENQFKNGEPNENPTRTKLLPIQKGRTFYVNKEARDPVHIQPRRNENFEVQESTVDLSSTGLEENDDVVRKILSKSRNQNTSIEQDIFVRFQEEEARDVMKEYSSDIIDTLKEKDERERLTHCLGKHKISPMLRSKMVDWMIEVMCSYKCLDQTFFLAIDIMDSFFQKSDVCHGVNDLHLVGVTSMFMAAKFEEIYPMKLQVIHEKIAHRKLGIDEIIRKEGEILQVLGFNITPTTTYDFVTNTLYQLNLKESITPELFDYLQRVCVYLTKANTYDYELISEFNHCHLAASTLFVAFKVIEQIEHGFPITSLMTKVSAILKVDDDILYLCASKILTLAKTFDYVYPNFQNLKKYHFIGMNEQALSSAEAKSPNHDVSYNS